MDREDIAVDIFVLLGIIAVVVLKVTNIITIPWIWLLSPLWIIGSIVYIGLIIITIIYLVEGYIRRKKR